MRDIWRMVYSLAACYGTGAFGAFFVETEVDGWYQTLEKPLFSPPDWLFAPVWMVLYGLMALALFLVWRKDPNVEQMRGWVPFFFVHLAANFTWTVLFFGFHALFLSFVMICILALAILFLIIGAREIDKRASFLLIPYLLWILFALALNASVWILN